MSAEREPMRRDGDDFPARWHWITVGTILAVIVVTWFLVQPIIRPGG